MQENIIVKFLKCFISIQQSSLVQFKLHFKDILELIRYYTSKFNFFNLNYAVAKILKKIYSKYCLKFFKQPPDLSKIFLKDEHSFINLLIVILLMFKQTKNIINRDSNVILLELNSYLITTTEKNKCAKTADKLCGIVILF
jgi:hypothetical protein